MPAGDDDDFLRHYDASERKIAAEFFTNWLPFLTRDLCDRCSQDLAARIRSLGTDAVAEVEEKEEEETRKAPSVVERKERVSWADMAQEEDELEMEKERDGVEGEVEEEVGDADAKAGAKGKRVELSREQREKLRFMSVVRKKDFVCFEKVKGKRHNILEGLELHTGVFSSPEQNRIVGFIFDLQTKGRNGELGEHTYSEPEKWMRGKGRVTIQFGCCYNYAIDKDGNPPGILQHVTADPLPPLFKSMIKRLVQWHILPPTCIPDSCIVNIYETGDCIPSHIDSHDFVRPFCTISFLSECNIVFGTHLTSIAPGEFAGSASIPLPVGSVLVINGNAADKAKHCVPAVSNKRVSITFRKMDDNKLPFNFNREPDLLCLQPLPYNADEVVKGTITVSESNRKHLLQGKMLDRVKEYVGQPQGPHSELDTQDKLVNERDVWNHGDKGIEHVGRALESQPDLQDSLVHKRDKGKSNNRSSHRHGNFHPVKESTDLSRGDGILGRFAGRLNFNPASTLSDQDGTAARFAGRLNFNSPGTESHQDDAMISTVEADGIPSRFAGRLNFNSPGTESHQDDARISAIEADGSAGRLVGRLNFNPPNVQHHQDNSRQRKFETPKGQREPLMRVVHMDDRRIIVKTCLEEDNGFSQNTAHSDPHHSGSYRVPTRMQNRVGVNRPRS